MLPVLVGTRFQVLFHSPSGVLFTFPSRYSFTIGRWVVFRLGGWSRQIPAGLHVSCGTQVPATPRPSPSTGLSPSMADRSKSFHSRSAYDIAGPTTPAVLRRLVWPLLRSLAATRRITVLFSFPPGTEMFHFPGFALPCLCIQHGVPVTLATGGFPHSGIHGSRPVSGSPWLIAAVHALLRLPSPRHPPCALRNLIISLRRSYQRSIHLDRNQNSMRIHHVVKEQCQLNLAFAARENKPSPCQTSWCFVNSELDCRNVLIVGVSGAGRDRTDDPRLAKPMLSQLSYSPIRLKTKQWAQLDLN